MSHRFQYLLTALLLLLQASLLQPAVAAASFHFDIDQLKSAIAAQSNSDVTINLKEESNSARFRTFTAGFGVQLALVKSSTTGDTTKIQVTVDLRNSTSTTKSLRIFDSLASTVSSIVEGTKDGTTLAQLGMPADQSTIPPTNTSVTTATAIYTLNGMPPNTMQLLITPRAWDEFDLPPKTSIPSDQFSGQQPIPPAGNPNDNVTPNLSTVTTRKANQAANYTIRRIPSVGAGPSLMGVSIPFGTIVNDAVNSMRSTKQTTQYTKELSKAPLYNIICAYTTSPPNSPQQKQAREVFLKRLPQSSDDDLLTTYDQLTTTNSSPSTFCHSMLLRELQKRGITP